MSTFLDYFFLFSLSCYFLVSGSGNISVEAFLCQSPLSASSVISSSGKKDDLNPAYGRKYREEDLSLADNIGLNTSDPYNLATLLLKLVLDRRNEQMDNSFAATINRIFQPSYKQLQRQLDMTIETLIERIQQYYGQPTIKKKNRFSFFISQRINRFPYHTYDPIKSLLASGFYCTIYWYTPNRKNAPDPLWEQISLQKSNIKGQQYYISSIDFQPSVINYSEILGPSIYVTAEGIFKPLADGSKSKSRKEESSSSSVTSKSRRTCPDIFKVTATNGTLHIFGVAIPLPIQGTSNVVVIYADQRIRIFVSPKESRSSVGKWEEAGLVVVQVRSDLVLGEPVLDLR